MGANPWPERLSLVYDIWWLACANELREVASEGKIGEGMW
jgi:hypothetical protein